MSSVFKILNTELRQMLSDHKIFSIFTTGIKGRLLISIQIHVLIV